MSCFEILDILEYEILNYFHDNSEIITYENYITILKSELYKIIENSDISIIVDISKPEIVDISNNAIECTIDNEIIESRCEMINEYIDLYLIDILERLSIIRYKESSIYISKEETIEEKIDYLKNIDQPDQRTTEWYKFRYNHLTASNAWKAFEKSESTKNQLIYEKCKPLDINKYKGSLNESPMEWGHKYEPISVKIYENYNNTIISDFGCLPHKKINYLAASPDGIVTGDNNFGRMIEIKNVVSRIITGNPKKDYYIQMQIQMEVCDLNECDFIETKFVEYNSYNDFINDGEIYISNDNKKKGILKVYIKNNEKFIYEYLDDTIINTKEKIEEWLDNNNKDGLEWYKYVYWKLETYSCILVPRCKMWFDLNVIYLDSIWKTIEEERINGEYIKRSPKKRKMKDKDEPNNCLIKII